MATELRSIWLRLLSAVAMFAPFMGLRLWANRRKGVVWGEQAWVGVGTYLDIHHSHPDPDRAIVLGRNVAIGNNTSLFTHDSLYNRASDGRDPVEFGRITVGDCVNISPHAFLYNCTIGSHSIVAPGSVVTGGTYPEYSLVAGNPARVVKDLRSRIEGADPAA